MSTRDALTLATAFVTLVAIAAAISWFAGLGQAGAVLTACVRALVQLLAVGAIIAVVLRTPVLAPVYLLVMVVAATWTSGRRLAAIERAMPAAGGAIVAGAGVTAFVVFVCQAVPFDARSLVPFVAQLVGGSMTATTLSGQRLIDDARTHWDEVEGWLALGASPRQAVAALAQHAASRALVPALDQTRNVGLVVLPGAFVGLLLGGATPIEAGRIQLLVLVGLLAAESVAAVTVTRLLSGAAGRTRPA